MIESERIATSALTRAKAHLAALPRAFRLTGQVCGAAALALGAATFVGWIGDRVHQSTPDTSIAFGLLGGAVILQASARYHFRWALCAGLICLVYAGVRQGELLAGVDLASGSPSQGVSSPIRGLSSPDRMPFFTALILIFAAVAFTLQTIPGMTRRAGRLIGFLTVTVLAVSLVFLLGYVFGVPFFAGQAAVPMDFATALGFLFLGAGLIAVLEPRVSPFRQLWQPTLASRLLRAFLPFTLVLVALVAGLTHWLAGMRSEVPPALVTALLAVGAMFLAAYLCDRSARAVSINLERTERRLRAAEQKSRETASRLEMLNASLEQRVADRTEALQASRDRLDQFFTILTSLQNPDNADNAFELVLRFCQRLGYDQAMLSLIDREAGVVRAVKAVGAMAGIVARTVRPLDGTDILAEVAREGVSIVIPDSTKDPRCDPETIAASHIRGQVILPLVSDEAVGILQVASRAVLNPGPDDLRALETLASEAARALGSLRSVEKIRLLNRQMALRNEQLQTLAGDLQAAAHSEQQAKDALRESEERLRLLLESSGEGVYGLDLEGRCTFINKSAAEMLGGRPADFLDRPLHDLIHQRRPDRSPYPVEECPIYHVLHSGTGCRIDTEVFWRLDGAPIPVDYSSYPIREGDRVRGAVVTFNDITERKQAEESLHFHNNLLQEIARAKHEAHEALKKAQSQLVQSEKLTALGQMVAGVAHEINNPLSFVSNNLAVLQRDVGYLRELLALFLEDGDGLATRHPELAQQIRELAERIDLNYTLSNLDGLMARSRDGVKRIQQIVLDLRDFARLDESDLKEVDLNTGIASTLNIVRNLAKKREVEIVPDLASVPAVTCFPAKINQVVLNLVANAIDACPPGGRVTVQTKSVDAGIAIIVRDTGCGIGADVRDKIFDPFFTTKPPGQGTGLGLSISYQIVQDHGGLIEVDSTPNVGTCFTVTLPLRPRSGGVRADAAVAARPSTSTNPSQKPSALANVR